MVLYGIMAIYGMGLHSKARYDTFLYDTTVGY